MGRFGRMFTNRGNLGKITLAGGLDAGYLTGAGVLLTNDKVKDIFKRRAADRQAANLDKARALKHAQEMKALGDSEMGKYDSGELTEGQQANVTRSAQIQRAQLMQALSSGGIADSSTAVVEKSGIEKYGAGLKENYREAHWDAAMKAYGLSSDARNTIHKMNTEHMQENIQIYSGLLSILGGAAGTWAGGDKTDKSATSDKKMENNTEIYGLEGDE